MTADKQIDFIIGAHTSIGGGVHHALLEGKQIGATTIQMFTANQKRWAGKALTPADIDMWHRTLAETNLSKIMSHDSYLINLGSPVAEGLEKSRKAFSEEIDRCQKLSIDFLNFHPGAALDSDPQQCLDTIVQSLLLMEPFISKGKTKIVLEATAGQGSAVGWRFEHLGYIIQKVKDTIPIGVCIDTCHIFAAGYDIRTREAWDKTLEEFENKVGLKYLEAFHVNDSLKGLGTRVDRHAFIGKGEIGLEAFRVLMTHPKIRHLPKYLETPGDLDIWKEEILLLKSLAKK
jgi:deoxyribonuclease-4